MNKEKLAKMGNGEILGTLRSDRCSTFGKRRILYALAHEPGLEGQLVALLKSYTNPNASEESRKEMDKIFSLHPHMFHWANFSNEVDQHFHGIDDGVVENVHSLLLQRRAAKAIALMRADAAGTTKAAPA
jgi:hypothetical protein